ncbi:Poly(U)-specific endoribonuclease-B [Schistosoma japonicum]|uniref:Uridylate-specific endoribonuclease n=1 Tax=Schistosoma japonicum TaxID=6182 RepID=A0A4Z2D2F9_SCHJA|nr:Poly(U)-specific endoribonuclease-B [Schistosoma japonicum]
MDSIPRSLPLTILEKLSILFSDYFINHIKHEYIYQLLNDIQWERYIQQKSKHTSMPYPLFPTNITPDYVFNETHITIWKDILLKWNDSMIIRQELTDKFMEQIYQTTLFHRVYDCLQSSNIFNGDRLQFKDYFHQIWFHQYSWNQMSTKSISNTCGFQHVFIGDIYNSCVKGLHHWKRYYILERIGQLQLHNIYKKHSKLYISSMKFEVDHCLKPYGTIFFGLTIDFEILLYFCAFLINVNRQVNFIIDNEQITVVCYDVAMQNNALATAFIKY